MVPFLTVLALVGVAMLVWDCVEVGRNDATNIVNAVFGSRILSRRTAALLAGAAVILGAMAATPVMETARKGIFDPGMMQRDEAMVVYISIYLVHAVLLYSYSAFGMPVSTTTCVVFALVGAALGMYGPRVVYWDKVGEVLAAILVSIFMAGVGGFMVQRVFRAAIRNQAQDRQTVSNHGPWIAGLMLTWLGWFMLLKGLKGVAFVEAIRSHTIDAYGLPLGLLLMWAACTLLVHLILTVTGERGARHLFQATALVGMLCMAFAFGQNDLANAAAPGVSTLTLYFHPDQPVSVTTQVGIPIWGLFLCGLLIAGGMSTRNAQRVTRAQVNTGSQFDHVALYAPEWCQAMARFLIRLKPSGPEAKPMDEAPPPALSPAGKKVHYDALRASVITSISASVIALASSHGLPVSTTYVAFAAVVATGAADRVMARGDAHLKIGRAIWVVVSWFVSAMIAMLGTALVAVVVYRMRFTGIALVLLVNLLVRFVAKRRADAQEERIHGRAGVKDLDDQDDQQPDPATEPQAVGAVAGEAPRR
jgi:phosphate/sulfate permease